MFILRQRLFLSAVAVASTAWVIILVESAHANGKPTPPLGLLALLSLVCGAGTAVMALLPAFFVHRRFFAPAPGGGPDPDEKILIECAANHFLDGEARGGRLFVTERRFSFRPHKYNFQLAPWSAPWDAVAGFSTEPPNFFWVELRDGVRARLVIAGPNALYDELMKLPQTFTMRHTRRDRPAL